MTIVNKGDIIINKSVLGLNAVRSRPAFGLQNISQSGRSERVLETDKQNIEQLTTQIEILIPKDKFNLLINDTIKPLLKTFGFRKKALTFYKQIDDLIFVLNFQNSQGNSYGQTKFYINCGIYSSLIDKTVDNVQLNEPKEYECHYRKRISGITKEKIDGYEIDNNSDLEALTQKIKEDILIALNHYDKVNTTSNLTDLMINENMFGNNIFNYFISTKDNGNIEKYVKKMANVWSSESRWNSIKNRLNEQLKEYNLPITVEDILA